MRVEAFFPGCFMLECFIAGESRPFSYTVPGEVQFEKTEENSAMRRIRLLTGLFCLFSFFCAPGAFAGHASPALHPSFLKSMIQATGAYAEIIASDPATGYPSCLFIPDFKGSTVTIGFPASGVLTGKPFMLEIDGMRASVICTREGKLSLVDGDERVISAGIFGTLECLFNTLLTMLAEMFDSVLSLDILGFFESIVSGILGVIICIIY